MRYFIFLAVLAVAIAPASADEFGPRFGSTAPYALGNDINRAIADTQGMGAEDLNDIMPASGTETPAAETTEDAKAPAASEAAETVDPAQTPELTPSNAPEQPAVKP